MHFQNVRHQICIRQIVTCSKMVLKVRVGGGKVPNSTGLEKNWEKSGFFFFYSPRLNYRSHVKKKKCPEVCAFCAHIFPGAMIYIMDSVLAGGAGMSKNLAGIATN